MFCVRVILSSISYQVSKLTKELNCCVVFYPDFFFIQDLFTGKVKEIGEEEDGLYMLNNQDQFHIDQGHLLQQEDMRMKYCGIRD